MAVPPPAAPAQAIRQEAEKAASGLPPLLIEAERVAHAAATGLHGRRRAGQGESFWQHRAYAAGDPVASIDWRQSARVADRLYVRQNEWEAAAAVWIWRDPSRSLDYASERRLGTKRRRAEVLALALASLLTQAGERVGAVGGSPRLFHGRGVAERFLEALHVDAFDDRASSPPPIPIKAHARVVFISDFFSDLDAIAREAGRCAALGAKGVFVQIVDPAEEKFPFAGRTRFSDAESDDRLVVGDAGALRDAYRREFSAHREKLMAIAGRFNWSFIAHRTDATASEALLAIYLKLADQRRRSW